ncbi:MAG TPA: non-canonical purine NTP pyrophosphatase [Granulicella sp.]|jgi:XTP/dITP diphosphohydrolase|nr:non-canonical purine NTP pyrophosphatase [Granulicella sp.]
MTTKNGLRFLVASTNAGKLRDFEFALVTEPVGSVAFDLAPLPGLKLIEAPEEYASTFAGNAELKAVYYSRYAPGEMVLADDSGLEVDALDGAPGVRSARFAEDCNFVADAGMTMDARNNLCLLAALGSSPTSWTARYRCVLVAAKDGVVVATGAGVVAGRIVIEARGDKGFGYDPHFEPEGLTRTMAELDPQTRLGLSHRGRALVDLLRSF